MVPELSRSCGPLAQRLEATRWPPPPVADGPAAELLRHYAEEWAVWLRQEATNVLGQHQSIHTDHGQTQVVRFPGRGRTPLLLLHGWPSSPLAFHRVVNPLQDHASEVVLAALPGFGTSAAPKSGMTVASIAAVLADVMAALGHERFVVHGQDWGSVMARRIGIDHPETVIGVHVSAGLQGFVADRPECGRSWLRLNDFLATGAGYLQIQSRRPDFLAIGLTDTPVGLLAWQLDKYQLWQAALGADFGLGDDFILGNATLYWLAGTIGASMRIYADNRDLADGRVSTVPTGVSVFGSGDFASRQTSARANNLIAWYEHASGGHLAALDAATEFVADLSDFITRAEQAA